MVGVGGARPLPFTLFTITNKGVVNAPAERADTRTSSYFSSTPIPYTTCGPIPRSFVENQLLTPSPPHNIT